MPAGDLVLKLQSEDGSRLTFTFPVKKVEAKEGKAQAVEHLHINGWLLRPGNYKVEAACDGATAGTTAFKPAAFGAFTFNSTFGAAHSTVV